MTLTGVLAAPLAGRRLMITATGLSAFQKLTSETSGSITPTGSARKAGSFVAVKRVAFTLPSGPGSKR